jgi:hypothetical protein
VDTVWSRHLSRPASRLVASSTPGSTLSVAQHEDTQIPIVRRFVESAVAVRAAEARSSTG